MLSLWPLFFLLVSIDSSAVGDYILQGLDVSGLAASDNVRNITSSALRWDNISTTSLSSLKTGESANSSLLATRPTGLTAPASIPNATQHSSSVTSVTPSINSSSALTRTRAAPGTVNSTIASTGTGLAYASQCNSLWHSWTFASWLAPTNTVPETRTYTSTNWTAEISTLCDGHPRVIGTLTPTASAAYLSTTTVFSFLFSAPTPRCSINPSDCSALYEASISTQLSYESATEAASTTVILAEDATALTVGTQTTSYSQTLPVITVNNTAYSPIVTQYPEAVSTLTFYDVTCDGYGDRCPLYPGSTLVVEGYVPVPTVLPPTCSADSSGPECGTCVIDAGEVEVLYFPPESKSRDLCSVTPVDITTCPLGPLTAAYTAPPTRLDDDGCMFYNACPYASSNITTTNSGPFVVAGNQTYYQNRVYLSLQTVYATNDCGRVGNGHTGSILTLASSDVYSVPFQPGQCADVGASYDFNNLVPPVPFEAWDQQDRAGCPMAPEFNADWRCRDAINGVVDSYCDVWCFTIYDRAYHPFIAVPTQIVALDPAWSTCAPGLGGIYDPPRALTQALTTDGVSIPEVSSTPQALPAAAFSPAMATPTDGSIIHGSVSPAAQNTATFSESDGSPQPTAEAETFGSGLQVSQADIGSGVPAGQSPGNKQPNDSAAPSSSRNSPVTFTANQQSHAVQPVEDTTGAFVVDGSQTVQAGGAAVPFGSATVSAVAGGLIIDGTQTIAVAPVSVEQPSQTIFVAGGVSHTAALAPGSSGVVVLDGSTVTLNAEPTSIGGVQYQLGSSGLIVGGVQTIGLPNMATLSVKGFQTAFSANGGSHMVSALADSTGVVAIDGKTVSLNGGKTTINGVAYSLGTAGVVVGGTSTLPANVLFATPSGQAVVFSADGASHTILTLSGSPNLLIIDGTTVTLNGKTTTIGGVSFSLGTSEVVVDGTRTVPIVRQTSGSQTVFTADGSTHTVSFIPGSTNVAVVDGQTITFDSQIQTINGVRYNEGLSGLVVDGTSTLLWSGSALSTTAAKVTSTAQTGRIDVQGPSRTAKKSLASLSVRVSGMSIGIVLACLVYIL